MKNGITLTSCLDGKCLALCDGSNRAEVNDESIDSVRNQKQKDQSIILNTLLHTNSVLKIVGTENGRCLTCCKDGAIRVWDYILGSCLRLIWSESLQNILLFGIESDSKQ